MLEKPSGEKRESISVRSKNEDCIEKIWRRYLDKEPTGEIGKKEKWIIWGIIIAIIFLTVTDNLHDQRRAGSRRVRSSRLVK